VIAFWIIFFIMGSMLDFATSYLGILGIFGVDQLDALDANKIIILIIALIACLAFLALQASVYHIWFKEGGVLLIFIPLQLMSVAYDAFTSYFGIAQLVVLNKINMEISPDVSTTLIWDNSTMEQKVLILFVTILITASPIISGTLISDQVG
jgi:hypothetical protein